MQLLGQRLPYPYLVGTLAGIVANVSLVGISVFNGVSQGSQPLFSEHYGKGDKDDIKILRKLSIITSLLLSELI